MKKVIFTAILLLVLGTAWVLHLEHKNRQFIENLPKPPSTVKQTVGTTEASPTFETDDGLEFVKQEEAEPQIINAETEEASLDEFSDFLDELGDEAFAARFENSDTTVAVDETFVDVLQEQLDNSWKISSIEGLDSTVEWIEIDGNVLSGDIINLEGLGDTVIIDVVIE